MKKLSCPSCGAEVTFKSPVSVFGVCTFCNSMLVRRDLNLDNLGKMAELPEDQTPLQVGTRGQFESKSFELLGRLKMGWQDGSWNEWYALFDDGREGWLAEAQGFYMVSFQVTEVKEVPTMQNIRPGSLVSLHKGQMFQVDDVKQAECIGSEGELPFQAPKGRKCVSVDLSGPDGLFGSIDYSDQDGVRLYIGKYVDFDSFKLTGLRELDGW